MGLSLIVLFCLAIPFSDALSKLMAEAGLAVVAIIAVRFLVQGGVLVPAAWAMGQSFRFSATGWWLTAARTALQVAGLWTIVTALRFMPLADTMAIVFVMPLILLLFGHLFAGEHVGPHRLAACVAGFGGTLMVIQPAFAEVGWIVLLPLATAVIFAAFMMITRRLSREVGAVAMQGASGAMGAAGLAAWLAAFGVPEAPPAPFPGGWWPILLLAGLVGTLAHLLMTASLRYAPSSTLAPMQYLEIPMATLVGWAVFGELPNGLAAVGIVVTIAVGLYVIARERRAAQVPA
nr:DMT family transporter [Jannaschia sp. Os4]